MSIGWGRGKVQEGRERERSTISEAESDKSEGIEVSEI